MTDDRNVYPHDHTFGSAGAQARKDSLPHVRKILDILGALPPGEKKPLRICRRCQGNIGNDPHNFGMCPECVDAATHARQKAHLVDLWAAAPDGYDPWASFGEELLIRRVHGGVHDIHLLDRETGSAVIFGPSGSGKTALLVAKWRQLMRAAHKAIKSRDRAGYQHGARSMYVTGYDIGKAAQDDRSRSGRHALIDRAIAASVLLLDALGSEVGVWRTAQGSVREVLHERLQAGRHTIVATQLNVEDLAAHYGHAISRRLTSSLRIVLQAPTTEVA